MSFQETILVVDDSEMIRSHLCENLLPALGYRALTAASAQEGWEVLRRENVDVLLLDLQLPDVEGIEVLRQLRQEGIALPVILMTGYGSEQIAVEALRLGVADYLIKPFRIEELEASLNRALAQVRLERQRQALAQERAVLREALDLLARLGPRGTPVDRNLLTEQLRILEALAEGASCALYLEAQGWDRPFLASGPILVLPSQMVLEAWMARESVERAVQKGTLRRSRHYVLFFPLPLSQGVLALLSRGEAPFTPLRKQLVATGVPVLDLSLRLWQVEGGR